ncbi:MAG: fused MFS/spermidine synthase [Phycisphaerales bacterium]|nr:MAG: fused MFS/spermidine synthase [Phycisphaerales bacterium]
MRKAVLPLFLVSGATGLIYEVAWTRAFGVVFGNTVLAVSTVLTAFMLGLAIGSWLFGRIADRTSRPLKLYALLELIIGAYALAFPGILGQTDALYLWFFRSYHPGFYSLSLVCFALAIVQLLLPTALMGGTLPVLSKLWADAPKQKAKQAPVGQSVGFLYAVNTFGAVVGTFLCGYFLLRILGVSSTIYLAAAANILVGLLALALNSFMRRRPAGDVTKAPARKPRARKAAKPTAPSPGTAVVEVPKSKRAVVLLAVAIAGFCALALEVLWTRVLVFVLGTSAYAFACMLTSFILGLALGSFICTRLLLPKLKSPILALGVVQLLVALSVLGSIPLLSMLWHIDHIITEDVPVAGFWRETLTHFLDAFVVLLVPAMLMGMVFPIAIKICARSWKAAGRRIGNVYASNTVGCVAGSFVAGFVLVPYLGLRDSFLLIISVQLSLTIVVILFAEKRRLAIVLPAALTAVVAIAAGFVYIPRDVFLRTMNTYHYPSKIIYIKDDATGTVTVHDLPDGDRLIAVDGVNVAGVDLMLRTTQKLQAYAPLLVHEKPQKVLQIGFGSGETSGVGLAFGVDEYNIAEICPGVFEAGRFFEDINRGSYKDPRLRKIIMDGKNFVKLTDRKFDVIMNDSTYPGTTGSSALYTYDHFLQCREHLNPGGVLSCWLPLDLRPEDFQIILRSFQAAMPHSSLWMVNNCLNKHAVLMATLDPMRIDFERVKRLVDRPDIAADLEVINVHSVYDFLDCFVVGEDGLRKIGGDGPLNTDDEPALEFGAAIKRDEEGCWMTVLGWMTQNHARISDHMTNTGQTPEQSQRVKATMQQYFTGTGFALQGLLALLQGDPEIMNGAFANARKANPQDRDVESCLEELRTEIQALVEARQRTPDSWVLVSRLAKRYLLLRDYENAAVQYRKFVELKPSDAGGWNNLGVCYEGLKQFDRATAAFRKTLEYDPQMTPAYINLSRVSEKLGDLPAATQYLEKALAVTAPAKRFHVYDRLARLHYLQKRYDLALKALDSAIDLASDNPELREYLQNRKQLVTRAAQGTKP